MSVTEPIRYADAILPGAPVDCGKDPRWQAIIEIGEYVESEPEAVWECILKWGDSPQDDLRDAIATCLLEHLLEHHFKDYFPRLEAIVLDSPEYGDTFSRCWPFGQAEESNNSARWQALQDTITLHMNSLQARQTGSDIEQPIKKFNPGS